MTLQSSRVTPLLAGKLGDAVPNHHRLMDQVSVAVAE